MTMVKKILILAVCFSLVFPVNALLAAPSGGQVVQGQADIGRSGAKTTINQSSNRAIVNWKNFDIGKNESVLHNMPSRNSAALHRVVGGGGASQLAGELKSNGNIFLVNPAGVVIHKGARIDTGGFLATTHDIANEDFMRGNYAFTRPGQPGASVINRGNITVRDQGFAALVAPTVRNEGVIAARLGKVALASGDAFKLDLYGDDLINFTVPESSVDRLHTTDGVPLGVDNSGTIKAEGGLVLLSATQLDGVVSSVVNNSGVVSASSAELRGGRIVFGGEGVAVDVTNTGMVTASSDKGDGGTVRMAADGAVSVSGTVEARGADKGGQIDVSGKKKTEIVNAALSTEGGEGGLIRVGGEFQGGRVTADDTMKAAFVDRFPAEALASTGELFVDAASSINAGRDGTLIAWSGGATELHGGLTGRYVETSGKTLTVSNAPRQTGSGIWLIDPTDVEIKDSPGDDGSITGGTTTVSPINGNTIDTTWLRGALESHPSSTLMILADNAISVLSALTYDAGHLFLGADTINVLADITAKKDNSNMYGLGLSAKKNLVIGDDVTIDAGRGISLGYAATGTDSIADITIGKGALVNAQSVQFNGKSLTLKEGASITGDSIKTGNAFNGISLGKDSSLSAQNGIDLSIKNSGTLTVGGALQARTIDLAAGNIVISDGAAIRSRSNAVSLTASSSVRMDGSTIEGSMVSIDTYTLSLNNAWIRASGSMFLTADRLAIRAGAGLESPISVKDYLTFTTSAGNFMTIDAGTEGRASIKAGTAYFVQGGFALNPYSIQADYVGWDSGVSLVGPTGGGDEPHIFGVKGLYPNGQSSSPAPTSAWPFEKVNLNGGGVLAMTEKREEPEVLGNSNMDIMDQFRDALEYGDKLIRDEEERIQWQIEQTLKTVNELIASMTDSNVLEDIRKGMEKEIKDAVNKGLLDAYKIYDVLSASNVEDILKLLLDNRVEDLAKRGIPIAGASEELNSKILNGIFVATKTLSIGDFAQDLAVEFVANMVSTVMGAAIMDMIPAEAMKGGMNRQGAHAYLTEHYVANNYKNTSLTSVCQTIRNMCEYAASEGNEATRVVAEDRTSYILTMWRNDNRAVLTGEGYSGTPEQRLSELQTLLGNL